MDKIKVIVIGAGNRSQAYTDIMKNNFPDKYEVVGVADPLDAHRNYIRDNHNIPEDRCFKTWEDILAIPKFADVAIIGTMDQLHFDPAIKAMNMGYNLLLEKPVAPTMEECNEIANCAERNNVKVVVCHVLRYTPFFMKIKELIDTGVIGKVMNVMHIEGVGNVHQSHSFVRGRWGNSERSCPMILAKCCHDTDIVQWLVDDEVESVQSYGSLSYFTEENAPVGAPERCHEGCPEAENCPYNAVKLYYDDKNNTWFRPAATGKINPTDEEVMEALKTTNYGKCVFHCDNDVVDHQVVNIAFKNGAVANLTMSAFNEGGRHIRVMGTKGEITGYAKDQKVDVYDFLTKTTTTIKCSEGTATENVTGGHGGGDIGIVKTFYDVMTNSSNSRQISTIDVSCKNHLISFAAEKSRVENSIVKLDDLRK